MRKSTNVKILKFKNKVIEVAQGLLTEARKNEPSITKELKAVAKLNDAKLVGLKNKFKGEDSLARKLRDAVEEVEVSVEEQAQLIDDALRYTMILSLDGYKKHYQSILSKLEAEGFGVEKIWDAWAMEGTPDDTGYRGINVIIISSQNQKFELQFHTTESFRVKTETHGFYEERRNPRIPQKRYLELIEIGQENANKIRRPKGI